MACDANLCPTLKPGLTVREYFAGQALAGVLAARGRDISSSIATDLEDAGRAAVRYADATLEALKKR